MHVWVFLFSLIAYFSRHYKFYSGLVSRNFSFILSIYTLIFHEMTYHLSNLLSFLVCCDASLVNGERDGLVLIIVGFVYYSFFSWDGFWDRHVALIT